MFAKTMSAKALSTKTTCFPFMHKWSKWCECVKSADNDIVQFRECTTCGIVQCRKSIRAMICLLFSAEQVNSALRQDRENRGK